MPVPITCLHLFRWPEKAFRVDNVPGRVARAILLADRLARRLLPKENPGRHATVIRVDMAPAP